jgi:hypothetical protein
VRLMRRFTIVGLSKRAVLLDRVVLFQPTSAGISRDLSVAARSLVLLPRLRTLSSRDRLEPLHHAFAVRKDIVEVALEIRIVAGAILFMTLFLVELVANIAMCIGLSSFVPLLSGLTKSKIGLWSLSYYDIKQLTLCPKRHCLSSCGRAYHRSMSFSVHFLFCSGKKSRKTVAYRPSASASSLDSIPNKRNFCEVESGMVVRTIARRVTPRSSWILKRPTKYRQQTYTRTLRSRRPCRRTRSCRNRTNNAHGPSCPRHRS